jgi:hypothetical protein
MRAQSRVAIHEVVRPVESGEAKSLCSMKLAEAKARSTREESFGEY